jgi:hypothetical protein
LAALSTFTPAHLLRRTGDRRRRWRRPAEELDEASQVLSGCGQQHLIFNPTRFASSPDLLTGVRAILLAPSISERHRNSSHENHCSNHQDDSCRVKHLGRFLVGEAPSAVVRPKTLKNDQGNRRKVLTRQKACSMSATSRRTRRRRSSERRSSAGRPGGLTKPRRYGREPRYSRESFKSKGAETPLASRACEVRPAAPSPAQMLGSLSLQADPTR